METALLILAGGRPMPNMLTIIHEKPSLIVAIVSKDQREGQIRLLQNALGELFHGETAPKLDLSHEIDAFNANEIYAHCLLAVEQNPSFQWIFNITCGTAIMSIGAYEAARHLVAQGRSVRCWYLDTGHTNLVALFGEGRGSDIFHISVAEYGATYGCRLVPGDTGIQSQIERWLLLVNFLVNEPDYIDVLQTVLKESGMKGSKPNDVTPRSYTVPKKRELLEKKSEINRLLVEIHQAGLLTDLSNFGDAVSLLLNLQAIREESRKQR
jgi:hypothetical protein